MKNILYLIFFATVFGCSQNTTQTAAPKSSKYSLLLTKYKDISFDTLKVFSSDNTEIDTFKYRGIRLDSLEVALLPKEISSLYSRAEVFAACFKFIIDSSQIGLITRIPSTYQSSSLRLLIFDRKKDSVTKITELAELVGDAGDSYSKDSWIFRSISGTTQIFGWIQEGHDNSIDNEKDTTVQITNIYYLLDVSKTGIDTISKNKVRLERQFEYTLKREASR